MAICTHTVDCGPLGEVELTISYKRHAGRRATQFEPSEAETATIYWIKIGGVNGVEVDVSEDYITDEIIPACVEDWNSESMSAAEERADAEKLERMEAERIAA